MNSKNLDAVIRVCIYIIFIFSFASALLLGVLRNIHNTQEYLINLSFCAHCVVFVSLAILTWAVFNKIHELKNSESFPENKLYENSSSTKKIKKSNKASNKNPIRWKEAFEPTCIIFGVALHLLKNKTTANDYSEFKTVKEDFEKAIKSHFEKESSTTPPGDAITAAWRQWPEDFKYDGKPPSASEREPFLNIFCKSGKKETPSSKV